MSLSQRRPLRYEFIVLLQADREKPSCARATLEAMTEYAAMLGSLRRDAVEGGSGSQETRIVIVKCE